MIPDLVQVISKDSPDCSGIVLNQGAIQFGFDLSGRVCYPKFKSMCDIDINLLGGCVVLGNKQIWQALPTNSFFCPEFAEIKTEVNDLGIGTLRIFTSLSSYGDGLYFYALSRMKPKRGNATYRSLGGATLISAHKTDVFQMNKKNIMTDYLIWLGNIILPESQNWHDNILTLHI